MKKAILIFFSFLFVGFISINAQQLYIDQSANDKSIKPGDDFYYYANGNWIKKNEIPASETSWGNSAIIRKQTRLRLEQILKEIASQKNIFGSDAQKLQDFYKSGMDTVIIEKLGIQPILGDLKRIDGINNLEEVMAETVIQYASGITNVAPLFKMGNLADPISNDVEIITFSQGGIGLPEKSYYFGLDEKSLNIRNQYEKYLQELLILSGVSKDEAKTKAKAILALETRLAKGCRTATENRNILKLLNYFTHDKLIKRFPLITWNKLFENLHIRSEKILIAQPEFFDTLNNELRVTNLNVWKDYLKVRLLSNSAPYLNKAFVKANFGFYSTVLEGQKQMKPRGESIINKTDALLGEVLGKLYVEKFFTHEAKKRIDDLVQNVIITFGERIQNNSWMTDSTKGKALQKLNAIRRKIAYPDKWRDYSTLTIGKNYYENVKAVSAFNFKYNMSLLGKPVDRNKWTMTPPTLNASYNPLNNEIVFPAGILLSPFFNSNADDAVNYGGIATVIGHEISHGFDDQGSQFNAGGQFRNWWTKTDKMNFETKGAALVNQFNQYVVLDSIHVNGKLTLGENIADLCGVTVAYQAFKKTEQGKSNTLIDGLTPDQRFFLSYATIWRTKQREESLRTQVLTDPHSPAHFRVNSPLSNLDAFYAAFNIKEGDKMWRPVNERIVIW